jgi:hypothetical protein
MASGKTIALILIAGAAAAGGVAALSIKPSTTTTPPPNGSCSTSSQCPTGQICLNGTCTSAVITLTISPSTITLPASGSATATATVNLTLTDGTPIANYDVTLVEITTGTQSGPQPTDSAGNATFNLTFSKAGSYQFDATG